MAELDGEPRLRATGLDLRVRARQENVAEVRRAFEDLDLPPRLLDDAKLLASELVTNSIRHSGLGPDDDIHVTATLSGTTLRVTVRDRFWALAGPVVAGSIRPHPSDMSGWGLYLVNRIASRWRSSVSDFVQFWFELELSSDPREP
jgi:anti-sigma regulatory factor (Ser/Thr protein kinase)